VECIFKAIHLKIRFLKCVAFTYLKHKNVYLLAQTNLWASFVILRFDFQNSGDISLFWLCTHPQDVLY